MAASSSIHDSQSSAAFDFEPNTDGAKLVLKPQGKISTPITNDPKFLGLIDKMGAIFERFLSKYKEDPKGILFRFSGGMHRSLLSQAVNYSLKMGDASNGYNAFTVSAVLAQTIQKKAQKITAIDICADWSKEQEYSAAIVTPHIVHNTPESLGEFSEDLHYIFSKINKNSGPRVIYIPCRFTNDLDDTNPRSHWLLIVVEKQGQQTIVTYINTRGGNHESQEPENRTLINQEKVLEHSALKHFNTPLIRNPETPICLTTKSCGVDMVSIAERLIEIDGNHPISEFVSKGGLLQKGDLASTDSEQADLSNRSRHAEQFIDFLQSWDEEASK